MPPEKVTPESNMEDLNKNIERVEELTQRLVSALSHQRKTSTALEGPGQELYMKAASAYVAEVMQNPSKMLEQQISYWGKSLKHWMEVQSSLSTGEQVPEGDKSADRRFQHELWQTNPYFNYIKQQYLTSSEAIEAAVDNLEGLDEHDKQRVGFFSRQIVDLFSPTNFLGSNPEALTKAMETNGQSLVDGKRWQSLQTRHGRRVGGGADYRRKEFGEDGGKP